MNLVDILFPVNKGKFYDAKTKIDKRPRTYFKKAYNKIMICIEVGAILVTIFACIVVL